MYFISSADHAAPYYAVSPLPSQLPPSHHNTSLHTVYSKALSLISNVKEKFSFPYTFFIFGKQSVAEAFWTECS